MTKRKFKLKGVLLAGILAVAGIFGVSSALINKQVNEEPVVEKAEAATDLSFYVAVDTGYTVKVWYDAGYGVSV